MIRAMITTRKKFWDLEMVIIGETHKQDVNDDIWGRQCVQLSILSTTFHSFPVSPFLPLIFHFYFILTALLGMTYVIHH